VQAINWKYPELFEDLANLVRSFPSVYQLLPIYKVLLRADGSYEPVRDSNAILNVEQKRVQAAFHNFHQVISQANATNRAVNGYRNRTQPVVGVNQDTFQSAYFNNGQIELSYHPPTSLDRDKADGDGTVPRVSAVPIELEEEDRELYLSEHHGWLTNVSSYLEVLPTHLRNLSAAGAGATLGDAPLLPSRRLSLTLDPLFLAGEPLIAEVKVADMGNPLDMDLRVEPVDAPTVPVSIPVSFQPGLTSKVLVTPPSGAQSFPIGLYRARLLGRDEVGILGTTNTTFEIVE
jgi:hypothetical protein